MGPRVFSTAGGVSRRGIACSCPSMFVNLSQLSCACLVVLPVGADLRGLHELPAPHGDRHYPRHRAHAAGVRLSHQVSYVRMAVASPLFCALQAQHEGSLVDTPIFSSSNSCNSTYPNPPNRPYSDLLLLLRVCPILGQVDRCHPVGVHMYGKIRHEEPQSLDLTFLLLFVSPVCLSPCALFHAQGWASTRLTTSPTTASARRSPSSRAPSRRSRPT